MKKRIPMKFGNPERSAIALYFSVDGKRDHAPRDEFAAGFEGVFGCRFDAAAAGYFHTDNSHTANVVLFNDFCKLLTVVYRVQFGASDESDFSLYKILMEICVSVSGTICSDKKVSAIEIRSINRDKLYLYRPLL